MKNFTEAQRQRQIFRLSSEVLQQIQQLLEAQQQLQLLLRALASSTAKQLAHTYRRSTLHTSLVFGTCRGQRFRDPFVMLANSSAQSAKRI